MCRICFLYYACFLLLLTSCKDPEELEFRNSILGTWKYVSIEYRNPDEKLNESFSGDCWKDNTVEFRADSFALFYPGEQLCRIKPLDTAMALKYSISQKDSTLIFASNTRYKILELSDSTLRSAEPAPMNGQRVYSFKRVK